MEFALAKSIAQSISELIEPAVSRAEIAGSIMRRADLPGVTYEMFISMNALSSFTMATGK